MNLVEHLRTWDDIPDDDAKAFHWLDVKTAEAADELEFLQQQLGDARRTGKELINVIESLRQQLATQREAIAEYVDRNLMSCREYADAIRAGEPK